MAQIFVAGQILEWRGHTSNKWSCIIHLVFGLVLQLVILFWTLTHNIWYYGNITDWIDDRNPANFSFGLEL